MRRTCVNACLFAGTRLERHIAFIIINLSREGRQRQWWYVMFLYLTYLLHGFETTTFFWGLLLLCALPRNDGALLPWSRLPRPQDLCHGVGWCSLPRISADCQAGSPPSGPLCQMRLGCLPVDNTHTHAQNNLSRYLPVFKVFWLHKVSGSAWCTQVDCPDLGMGRHTK